MKLIITTDDETSAAAALGCVVGCLDRMRTEKLEWAGHSIIFCTSQHKVTYDQTKTGTHTFRVWSNH